MKIERPEQPDFISFRDELDWYHDEDQRLVALAREQAVNGCFAVQCSTGFKLVTRDNSEEGLWRCTSYDEIGFPYGHFCERKWDDLAAEVMRGATEFVTSIPTPLYEQGTKEELLERIASGHEGKHTGTTLLLSCGATHNEIFAARREWMDRQDADYREAVESGDMETAKAILAGAAKERGFDGPFFHGTDQERTSFDGGAFFTDDRREAWGYAKAKASERFLESLESHPEYDEINLVLFEVMTEAGVESLTDMDADTVAEIIDANGFDVDMSQAGDGVVMECYLSLGKPLDLTDLGSIVGNVAGFWNACHDKGLLDQPWENLDKEVRRELKQKYRDKAAYCFLEEEGVLAKAEEKRPTVKFLDQGMGGRSEHTTWAVRENRQIRSANVVEYDDNGNLILPSQRFIGNGMDIRGNVPEKVEQEESEGVKL